SHLPAQIRALSSSSQLLVTVLDPMRKLETRMGGEPGQGPGSSSPAEQVKALVDLLAGKGSQGPQALQAPSRMPDSLLGTHGNKLRLQRHREALLSRAGGGPEPGGPPPRLTSLLLVEGLTDLQLREHDFTQVETTRGGQRPARTIPLDRLFLPLSRVSIPPRVSITVGVAGMGKTTLVRHFVRLWAGGQVGKDFSLVLPLTFRDLNTYEKLCVDRLICSAFPHIGESGLAVAAPARVLLILDGLDECKTPLDFSNTVACTDPKKEIQVDHLITNIIRGNLFPEVSVWITSRPGAAGQIPGGLVDRMTEIRGFTQPEMEECLQQMFPEDQSLPGWVLSQVRANQALYLMCAVPAFCQLVGAALGHSRRSRLACQDAAPWPPRTLAELYAWYFRMALSREGQDKGKASPRIEQLAQGQPQAGGDPGRSVWSWLLLHVDPGAAAFLQREETLAFFGCLLLRATWSLVIAAAGRLPAGPREHESYRAQAAELLQGCLRPGAAVGAQAVNVLRCLHELQCTELAHSVQEAMERGALAGLSSPSHRAALAYLLQVSDACAQEANLSLCLSQGVLQSLLPQLLYCESLRLDNNQFQDPVMELLGSMLSGKDCRIQKMSLAENLISNKGAKALARSLLVNRSLTALDLRSNSIGSQGAKALADALKINRTLTSLSLQGNTIRDDGARSVAEALASNRTLSVLHLQKNSIGPAGAQRMADALKHNRSLKELVFSSNSIGDAGAKALAEALKVNQGLESLDLQSNSISDVGVAALTEALGANQTLLRLSLRENSISPEGAQALAHALCTNSTLENLEYVPGRGHAVMPVCLPSLQWNFIQAGAARALGRALQLNRSLTSLDLQENAIGDEGASAVAGSLKVNTALTALYLQVASIGTRGAQALGEALAVNRTLEILDLRGNAIGVAGAKALAKALKVNSSLRRLNLQENSLGMDGAICVATALSGNHGLQHINLQGNQIGESGARMISEAIKTNAPTCTVDM
uniref:NLR family CARD domain containing 3 n=1 Tax=Oryctolagus cuniculus TaxID=9986 RepID=G1TTF6_RABIT